MHGSSHPSKEQRLCSPSCTSLQPGALPMLCSSQPPAGGQVSAFSHLCTPFSPAACPYGQILLMETAEKPQQAQTPEVPPSRNMLEAQRMNVHALCMHVPAHQAPVQHFQRYNNFSSAFTRRKEFSSSPPPWSSLGRGHSTGIGQESSARGHFSTEPVFTSTDSESKHRARQ